MPQPADLLSRYQRLIELSRDLASTLDLTTLLNRIVHAAADLSGAEAASILLYDPIKQELYFDAASNLEEPLMRGLVVPVKGSIAGWIVVNRESIIISETQKDPRHFGKIAQQTNVTTRSMLGLPLINNDKVIGALEAINKLEGEFTQQDLDLLTALGAQAAVAIENARLFQQSDLISELVHELRTPLTSLNTAAQMLHRPGIPDEMRKNLAGVIVGETGRLNDMTSAFLDVARLESGRMQFQAQIFELAPMIQECIDLMNSKAQERNQQITATIPGDLPALKADREKLKRVLLNLLSNAIKYTGTDGQIRICVLVRQNEMLIQVIDSGAGIPAESLPHIFEKFYRVPGSERVAQGTGLGLSICKRIIDAHRGQLTVESQTGQGTTFTITLPLKA